MTPPRFTRSLTAIAAGLLLSFSGQLSAHHAFAAEFDGEQPIEIKGLVSKITWVNPHSWLYVDVKDAKGQVTNWGFEFGTPFSLQQKGLNKSSLPPGTEVAIKGFRSKNGKPFAYAALVTLPDGRSFQTGGAPDVPATPGSAAAK